MNENIKKLIESLPDEGVDCKGKEWVRYKPTAHNFIDRTGEVYERLTALFPVKDKKADRTKWFCQCSCGNFIIVSGSDLKTKNTLSCGCLNKDNLYHRHDKEREEIIGKRFGRLTVISFYEVKNECSYFLCRCDCGNEIITSMNHLRTGHTQSCGCLQKEIVSQMNDKHRQEMIGKHFGYLKVLYFDRVQNDVAYYSCLCERCGSITVKRGANLLSGNLVSCGCMKESYGESRITEILEEAKIPYRKQQTFDDLRSDNNLPLRYDFSIMDENNEVIRLIEYDGIQHFQPVGYFGGEERFERQQYHDALKNQYALSHNIPLVRLPYTKRDSITIEDLLGDKYIIQQ